MKKLYRSEKDKVFAGVIGGLGEYWSIDPSVLRVLWLIIFVFTGFIPATLAYLLSMLIIPSRRESSHIANDTGRKEDEIPHT